MNKTGKNHPPGKVEIDPLKEIYSTSFISNPAHAEYLIDGTTALLCIDLQYLDAAEGCGIFKETLGSGVPVEAQEYYFKMLNGYVLPNVRQLQDAFRSNQLEVIHIRIQSLTQNGRDRSKGHKRLHILAPPGSQEAEFLPQVAPVGDEIVVNKTASGVFSSTNLNYVLKNMNIHALFIVGVYTNECVETTVRDACDLGYLVTLVEDCCTTVTPQLHEASLITLRDRYARVITMKNALADLSHFAS